MSERPGWDDERLAAAFRGLADRRAPASLPDSIHDRIIGTRPARGWLGPWGRPMTLGVIGLAAVVVAVALIGFGQLEDRGHLAGTSPSPTASEGSPTPPTSFFGLPTMSVDAALALRDAGRDDRELAVAGWFFGPASPHDCPAPVNPILSPVQLRCPDEFWWLMDDIDEPLGPFSIHPDLDGIDDPWAPVDGYSAVPHAVLVGHFDDRRAELCPPDEVVACRDRFVVDRVAWADGPDQPQGQVNLSGATPMSTSDDIARVVAAESPGSPILSTTIVDGPSGLAEFEPTLSGTSVLTSQPIVWIIRVLETDHLTTYLVIDGTDTIYEMNPEGDAILVGGSPATPSSTDGPGWWPPGGSITFNLKSQVAAGAPPARLAVLDESERMTDVEETGDVDPSTVQLDGRYGAYAEPGHPDRIHLVWVGGICDSQITVTITAGIRSIMFDMGPQPSDCDTIGVQRQVVLDFNRPVDVSAIELLDAGASPTATPEGGYVLDCGPLEPDTCSTKAAEILDEQRLDVPAVRFESIVFTDACGSYIARFDNGSGRSGGGDCP